jgi:hypothetical protein
LSPNAMPLSLRSLSSDLGSLRIDDVASSPSSEAAVLSSLKRKTFSAKGC